MSLPRPALLVLLSAAFAGAHTQAPLFYSNQNQYLLHGLAGAGYGHLSGDWLANTKDPTPLFSAGVGLAYRVGGLWPLQAGYFVLLMGYFLAAWWLATPLVWWVNGSAGPGSPTGGEDGGSAGAPAVLPWTHPAGREGASVAHLLAFAALFTAAHAGILRWLSVQAFGVDYPWYFQAGVAGQYVLGPGLQPSAFGVLLVASLAAFANGRPVLAGGLAGAAGLVHATYLLPAALLTVGYVAATWPRCRRRAAGAAVAALVVAAPMVVYAVVTFPPGAGGDYAESRRVLAEVRIPHHAAPARWSDGIAAAQCAWVAMAIVAVCRSRLAVPLAVGAAGGTALTLAQVATGDHALALVFPWRVSAVLVPAATAILAAKLVARLTASRVVGWASAFVLVALAAGGVAVMALGLGYRVNEAERPVLDWVKENAGPGDLYLIPAAVPAVGSGRGAASTSFTPPPRPRPGSNLIPVDLQQFRLATGVPIYVDFKSVPYGDAEVLEWLRRVRRVEGWYAVGNWDAGVRAELRAAGVTHVVMPAGGPPAAWLDPVYADRSYAVYRVE